jgi:hypothetical protein
VSDLDPIRQSEEGIDLSFVVRVGALSLLIALLSVLVVYGYLRARGEIGRQPQPRPHGRAGLILQTLIEPPERPGYSATPSELDRYGWVDGRRDVAQIPIERAMRIVAERGR